MSRWIAGSFDPHVRVEASQLRGALAPHTAAVLECGPLRVAYSGPPVAAGKVLCLFDGHLDNAAELDQRLRGDAPAPTVELGERVRGEAPVPTVELGERVRGEAPAPTVELGERVRGAGPVRAVERLLAAGYRRWGRELLPRLRGDFALLLWDEERGEGLIARDQLGVRPLFVHEGGGGVRFASEIRHLLALLPRRPPPDAASVAHWIVASVRPGPQTLFEGIARLEPGCLLLLDRRGVRRERYWTPRFREPLADSAAELGARVRTMLTHAVRRRIDPDGVTGLLLSGGLDSASVAAVAAGEGAERIRAFSGVFPEHPSVDESALISELRERLRLRGVLAEVRAGGLLACALESQAAWQAPLLGWGDFWTQPLLRAAGEAGIGVILGGDGGDELFGARSYLLADTLRAGRPGAALALALALPGAGARPPRREVAKMFATLALLGALSYRLHSVLHAPLATREAPRWLLRRAARELAASDDPLAWKQLDGPRWWAHAAYGLTRGIEQTGVYEHQRRRAALAGIEARHPLLDLDVLELGLRIPPRATLDPYRNRPVLRAAMTGLLPDAVRMRPQKAWFESLIVDCLTGPDRGAVQRLLTDPRAELRAYVDLGKLRSTLLDSDRELREQPFRWMWLLWRLATAECWLRAQADPSRAPTAAELGTSAPDVRLRETGL